VVVILFIGKNINQYKQLITSYFSEKPTE